MEKNEKTTRLPFFGIGRLLPFLGHVKKLTLIMVVGGLISSVVDVVLPLFQRYALDHFVRGRIREEGTHEELRSNGGIYQKIYETQTGLREEVD